MASGAVSSGADKVLHGGRKDSQPVVQGPWRPEGRRRGNECQSSDPLCAAQLSCRQRGGTLGVGAANTAVVLLPEARTLWGVRAVAWTGGHEPCTKHSGTCGTTMQ